MKENNSNQDLLNKIESLNKEIELLKNNARDFKKTIFFNALIEQGSDGFELLDEHGKFVDANSITCEQLGYSKEELLKKHIWEIDADLTEQQFYEKINFLKSHSPYTFEATHKKKTGEIFPVEINVSTVEIENKIYSLSIARDISERKRNELSLIKERNKFRQFLETIDSIIIALDLSGNVSMINRKGCDVLGYTENEVLGKNWFSNFLSQPIGNEIIFPLFKKYIAENIKIINYYESEIITKSGNKRTIAWNNSYLIGEDGRIIGTLSTGEDITEKLKIQNDLLNSEQLLKESQSVAKLGHYELDILTGFWTSSDELDNIFGINADYIKNVETWLDIVHTDYREEMQSYFFNYVLSGNPFDKMYKITKINSNESIWIHGLGNLKYNAEGKPIKMFGTIQDVNDKVIILDKLKLKNDEYVATNEELIQANEELIIAKEKAETSEELLKEQNEEYEAINEELRQTNDELIKSKDITEESERRIRTMFSSSNAGFVVINSNGKLIEWNKTFINYFGYTYEEFINFTSKDITYHEDIEESYNKLNQIKSGEISDFRIEKRFIRKDKSIFWADIFVSALKKNNTVIAFIGVVNDISYRKEFEEKLIIAKNKAEESDRLKSAFLANVSHEIRTPMNGIMGFSQMLASPEVTFEKRKFYSEIITNNCNQLLTILNDILDVSKIETGQMKVFNEDVNINNILLEMTSFFIPQATKSNINLYSKKEVPDEHAIIHTDVTKIRQIFTNLISNAIKFTNKGIVEFGYSYKNSFIEFYVKDTGIGILSDLQEKIFDRFRQAETSFTKSYGGTGLGLSISKGYVELMGGKIWLESEINKGTTFYFSLPCSSNDKIYQYYFDAKKSENKQVTVLVAEDEEINYLFIEDVLLRLNYKILHAKNGQQAVEIVKNNQPIDLIMMDMKMPIMNGFEATEEIRKINSKTPIIAQTAYALTEDIEKLKNFGFDDILTKPMTEKSLLNVIEKYI